MEIIINAFGIAVMVWAVLAFYRLHRFSKFVGVEIDRVFASRINGNREEQYPNITASYNNLKWYDMFNFNFKTLMVYDNTR
jgi:hypothetical protein